MKCPDCGSRLSEVRFDGEGFAMRCFRCGGFWIDSLSANKLSAESLTAWRRISIDPMWLRGGKGTCPLDGSMLTRYTGDSIPINVLTMRCVRCGKWWFPGDNLFVFKPALDAKTNYLRLWGLTGSVAKVGLPVIVTALLIGGMITGLALVKTKTQSNVPAAGVVRNVKVSYVRDGIGIATFEVSGVKVDILRYRSSKTLGVSRANEEGSWSSANVVCIGVACQSQLVGLQKGQEYTLEVSGNDYLFVAQ